MALARADQDRFARLATGTGRAAAILWEQLHPMTDAELLTWQRAIVPMVRGAQQAAAAQRIGYLTAYYELAGETPVQLDLDITGILGGLRNGTAPAEVYARPVVTARTALAEGKPWVDALRAGGARAEQTAETDVMLAARQAEFETMQQIPRVVGYRRVPNGGACKLCLAAATQRYHVRDLRPCHGNCRCGVVPIIGTQDPGHIIDRDAYERLKASGAFDGATAAKRSGVRYGGARTGTERRLGSASAESERTARQADAAARNARSHADRARAELAGERDPNRRERLTLRAQEWDRRAATAEQRAATARSSDLFTVHEHGELGPTLAEPGQHFTGPAGIPAA